MAGVIKFDRTHFPGFIEQYETMTVEKVAAAVLMMKGLGYSTEDCNTHWTRFSKLIEKRDAIKKTGQEVDWSQLLNEVGFNTKNLTLENVGISHYVKKKDPLTPAQIDATVKKIEQKNEIFCAHCHKNDLLHRATSAAHKGLKMCQACPKEDAAYYCSTDCQKSDWAKHKVTCVGMKKCQGPECTKLDHEVRKVNKKGLQLCSQCKTSSYCSKECQKAHWKAGHKEACQKKG